MKCLANESNPAQAISPPPTEDRHSLKKKKSLNKETPKLLLIVKISEIAIQQPKAVITSSEDTDQTDDPVKFPTVTKLTITPSHHAKAQGSTRTLLLV